MVGIGRTSNAFFFDGVTDSILIPQGNFTSVGPARDILAKTGKGSDEFTNINSMIDGGFALKRGLFPIAVEWLHIEMDNLLLSLER
jgi:hypothetical protein